MNSSAAKTYQTQQIMTASPAKLVAMLFDRAIGSLKEAAEAIGRGDIEARCRSNKRATEIVFHLYMTLDVERGGEIAANLKELYSFVLRKLPEVDFKNDAQAAQDVIRLLEPLRRSWHELAQQGTPGRPAPAAGVYGAAAPAKQDQAAGAPTRQVYVSA
ncbi:flagellar protein FliS [Tistlia consotensis]|uniref:Flagellar protein FliS n=1 Tax=Tistlia consotensis USBA 355 TaxID=560819 RepID=A0A1Y6CIE7_9PROT|nr:flagellar export chaperone FliS [Tistlia consotensis]SMF67761.1 flagellar protein FliS [Tistlia consotensis USBA 355]SNR99541.1 flagellar protein FliS [Tistlia consotensis]